MPKNPNYFFLFNTPGIRYAEFVVPLVKAVQEQQEIIEQLIERIEVLEKIKYLDKSEYVLRPDFINSLRLFN